MRKITCITIICINMVLLSSCHIYRNYQRPDNLPTDSLFRDADNQPVTDSLSLGDLPWQEIFQDTLLQQYIRYGLEHNTDMQTALLRVDQAKAQLTAAKLSFLPSLTLSPQGTLTSTAGSKTVKTYELPVQASWEIDLFGNLRNAKKGTQATLLQQQAYQQAVRSELIAGIANTYYSLLMLDEQVAISQSTLEVWKEQVRTMEARMKVGEETENAVTQARASLYELEATHNDLLRQQRETENSLCTLLGMTSRSLERGTLDKQIFPETLPTGIPVRLLSRRPDIVQAEMTLANAYYTTNQARSAFYPNLNLSGSAGWTNALGQAVTNPGDWILSAVASLTQPLFNRGKLISNLRVSKDEEQIALLNYRQALLDAGQEVNDALYATESAGRSLESHRKQCRELERTVQTSEALYRTGNATYLELLTARQSLLNARLNVVTDSFTQCQAVINLYQALGGGAE
ncbi:efflux transporter outer membrane subunit [Phocaeicola barnesiae]|jgi:multidrug efflux system outer membrane protein|uniref:efflux transporter outer membrane subunit n=1 Tax=Phocaeicola barnesiae TaxID=376804 RepID=UPI00241E9E2E|nr:efflux transporter outer membrane subunit [Phocaeicola barnesiae]MDM8233387.1 efflux transporter outer membrane subunit [Phocaeicola barnesiae]MDM8250198.1 efflux transporter outer membrane subunit [Phocaeicola barnesiae]MDM8256069.1 efflux transporter outer membrane subunit [Phocaeicola barnesiae]